MSFKTIREADARIDAMNQRLHAAQFYRSDPLASSARTHKAVLRSNPSETGAASTHATAPNERDRGGVITDVVIEVEHADLRHKREAILNAIRPGQLATDLPIKEDRSHAP